MHSSQVVSSHQIPSFILLPPSLLINTPSTLRLRTFTGITANNLEIHAALRIQHKRAIVPWMVVCSGARRAVASPAGFQSRSVELLDLVCICVARCQRIHDIWVIGWTSEIMHNN